MPEADPSTSILVIHDPSSNPIPFLQRLTTNTDLSSDNLRWDIDNKYYTAAVGFDLVSTGPSQAVGAISASSSSSSAKPGNGVPVVLYLFTDTPPNPLPPILTQTITSEPRDIAIAIRIRPDSIQSSSEATQLDISEEKQEAEWEAIEDTFVELGMEVIDELATEGEGEKSLDPLEEIRITIQTHIWPNMIRKPLPSRGGVGVNLDFDDEDDSPAGSGESEYDDEDKSHQVEFPVDFTSPTQFEEKKRLPEDEKKMWEREWEGIPSSSRLGAQAQFPSLQTLNEQLAETSRLFAQLKEERDLAQIRRMERLDRLEKALDDDSDEDIDGAEGREGEEGGGGGMRFEEESGSENEIGPDEGEWERLDDWLDDEEGYEALDDGEVGETPISGDNNIPPQSPSAEPDRPPSDRPDRPLETPGFEDDFSSFQSAPSRTRLNNNGIPAELPMDPTPLLMHLQSVRTELAGVTDEDERRVRAAREVMAVLGLDMGDIGDLALALDEEIGEEENGDNGLVR